MRVEWDLGRLPTRRVSIGEIAGETDAEILALALDHTGETVEKLFGTSVTRHPDTATALVLLFTD